MKTHHPRFTLALLLSLLWLVSRAAAQAFPPGQAVHYELVDESMLVEDCYPCGPPTVLRPMRGSFDLVLVEETPISARFELRGIHFEAGTETEPRTVTGSGTLEVGGEVALRQTAVLEVKFNGRAMVLTNESPALDRWWPMVAFTALETPAAVFYLRLDIAAAPLREVWFSTAHGMTPGLPFPGFPRLSAADLLAEPGRVVRSEARLLAALELDPFPTAANVDALAIGAGGEVMFSLDENVKSAGLGELQEGDLVSAEGRIVAVNQALTNPLGIQPPVPDLGLDAWFDLPDGSKLFSTRQDAFSERLGRVIGHGDVLTSEGALYRSNADLLARFVPTDAKLDYGLDAIHVWPSGEIWFSTRDSFESASVGHIGHGDLLSETGYVVRRNLRLVAAYQPLEDLADFGLDALFIVTDLNAATEPPVLSAPLPLSGAPGLRLSWTGRGRVFLLERATDPAGPYAPLSPLTPDLGWKDPEATWTMPSGFYRVRQW